MEIFLRSGLLHRVSCGFVMLEAERQAENRQDESRGFPGKYPFLPAGGKKSAAPAACGMRCCRGPGEKASSPVKRTGKSAGPVMGDSWSPSPLPGKRSPARKSSAGSVMPGTGGKAEREKPAFRSVRTGGTVRQRAFQHGVDSPAGSIMPAVRILRHSRLQAIHWKCVLPEPPQPHERTSCLLRLRASASPRRE